MSWLEFSVRLIEALVWPGTVLATGFFLVIFFGNELRAFLGSIESVETGWFKLCRTAQRAAPEKDIPLPPPSPKQRIMDEWQKVHDALTALYEENLDRTAPPQYAPLVTRLKKRSLLTEETVALLGEVRSVWRGVKRQPGSSVSAERADYYEHIVQVVLELLNTKAL